METLQKMILENKAVTRRVTIPNGIMPPSVKFIINNVLPNKRVNQNLHKVYKQHADLHRFVPRGLSFATLHIKGNFIANYVLMAGMREYGDIHEVAKLNFGSIANAPNAVLAVDVDGVTGMFTGLSVYGEFYLIAGTTEAHIVFNSRKHIDLYVKGGIYLQNHPVIEMAKVVMQYWSRLSEVKRKELARDMMQHKHTINFKLLNAKHLGYCKDVKFDDAMVQFTNPEFPNLVGIALTSNNLEKQTSLLACHPVTMYHRLQCEYLLNTPKYETVTMSDITRRIMVLDDTTEWIKGHLIYYVNARHETECIVSHQGKWFFAVSRVNANTPTNKRRAFNPQVLEYQVVSDLEKSSKCYSKTEIDAWGRLALSWFYWKLTTRHKVQRNPFMVDWKNITAPHIVVTYNGK